MRRWHQEKSITLRNWRNLRRLRIDSAKNYGEVGRDPYDLKYKEDNQIGRYRKRDAYDCGNTRCYLCHNEKLPKRQKHEQEMIADVDFKEQLKELENGNK